MNPDMDWDEYGHCVWCHKNMLVERVSDMKVIKMFTPDYDETEFLLNDGSRMRVAICKPCKANITDEDNQKIMACVIKGWQKEVDMLVKDEKRPDWTEERAEAHMDKYSSLQIVTNSTNLPQDICEEKLAEFKEGQ